MSNKQLKAIYFIHSVVKIDLESFRNINYTH